MGWVEGRQTQSQAQNDDQAPGLFRNPQQNLFHILFVAPDAGEVKFVWNHGGTEITEERFGF